jgi:membrane protein YqaA with SNARE-associated domain
VDESTFENSLLLWYTIQEYAVDWQGVFLNYGALGLGVAALLSATLLPLSSEALLVMGIAAGVPVMTALTASCIGNCVGCALNYGLGAWLREKMVARLEQSASGRRAIRWMERHGAWSLWGSWLPFVGDPLTFLAGAVRTRIWLFVVIVFTLRVMRYVLTLYGGSFFLRYS